jgi:hypothetical protein
VVEAAEVESADIMIIVNGTRGNHILGAYKLQALAMKGHYNIIELIIFFSL